MAPGTVAPRPMGSPTSFQTTVTTKPPSIPAMMPALVALFQYRAARAGSPAAAA